LRIISKKVAELLDSQSGITNNSKHRERIHRIMARNRDRPAAIGHNYVPALTDHSESSSLQSLYRLQVMNARQLSHSGRHHFDVASLFALIYLIDSSKIIDNRGFDILQGFFLGVSLRPAAGEFGTTYCKSLLGRD
jgi:hypothetical protein